jgi:hypothetical protein
VTAAKAARGFRRDMIGRASCGSSYCRTAGAAAYRSFDRALFSSAAPSVTLSMLAVPVLPARCLLGRSMQSKGT